MDFSVCVTIFETESEAKNLRLIIFCFLSRWFIKKEEIQIKLFIFSSGPLEIKLGMCPWTKMSSTPLLYI